MEIEKSHPKWDGLFPVYLDDKLSHIHKRSLLGSFCPSVTLCLSIGLVHSVHLLIAQAHGGLNHGVDELADFSLS